jgi:ABC-type multidrug transport system fused ATPase/permease subunit
MFSSLKKLFDLFDKRTRLQLLLLFGLMLLSSILETAGVGLVAPFIKLIEDPEIIMNNQWLRKVYEITEAENLKECLLFLSIGLIAFYFIKNICLGVMNYLQLRFVFSKRSSLGKKLFSFYLHRPYAFHLLRNSAELLRNIGFEVARVYVFVQSLLKLCTELCILICILAMLVWVNPRIAIASVSVLAAFSGVFYLVVSGYTRTLGQRIQSSQRYCNQAILEGFGAIKEVKVSGTGDFFADRYYDNMMENARANWTNSTLTGMPRLFLEVIAVGIVILIIILLQGQGKEIKNILPTLGLFAMATIRMMPSLYLIVSNLQQLRFNSPAVDVIYEDFLQSSAVSGITPRIGHPTQKFLPFRRVIRVENLVYAYPNDNEKALHGVSLKIQKGQAIAFVGASGAGKTTLADVIMGLLEPSEGMSFNILSHGNEMWAMCLSPFTLRMPAFVATLLLVSKIQRSMIPGSGML